VFEQIRWAGQTAAPGGAHSSDGILTGDVDTVIVPCDTTTLTCTIKIYAPSFALVFLTKEALDASSGVVLGEFETRLGRRTEELRA